MKRSFIAAFAVLLMVVAACVAPADAKPKPCKGWRANEPGCQTTTTIPTTTTTTQPPTTTQPTTTTTTIPTTTTTSTTTSTTSTTSTSTTSIPPTTTTTTTTTIPPTQDDVDYIISVLESTGYIYINREYIIDRPLDPPNGSTIDFGPNGKFKRTSAVDGTRILPIVRLSQGDITINDAHIEGPNTGRYTRTLNGRTYLFAHEGTGIGGVDPNMEENAGIEFNGGSNYEINNPWIESVWGDGFTVNGQASNIVINNPQVHYVGRSIISNLDSNNVTINGGYGTGAFWWGINMETIGSRSVNGFDVNSLEIYYTRFQPVFADGTYFNCMVYNANIDVDLSAEYYDPAPNWDHQNMRNQAVKIDTCAQSEINVNIRF